MGIFRSSKKLAGRIIDTRVDRWISWEYLSETTDRFKILITDIFIPKKASFSETFDEALQRLELSEEDLIQRKKEFSRLFYFFLGLTLLIIVYALYMAVKGNMVPSLIAFCLALYALAQAFRFHFWLFQVKNRKLGCTLKEWFNSRVHHPQEPDAVSTSKSLSTTSEQQDITTEKAEK